MFRVLSYLNFVRKSTNAHGVHSPFVFKFVTDCLYGIKKRHRNKSINVLLKSIDFFQAENVSVMDHLEAAQAVIESFPGIEYQSSVYDVVFARQFDEFHFNQLLSKGQLQNNSVVFIGEIHQNSQKNKEWCRLIALPEITVSIDMFHLGAIFIRKEQEKEHFTIRI